MNVGERHTDHASVHRELVSNRFFFLVFVWILVLLGLGGATSCVVSKEMSADSKMKGVIVSAFAKVSCASLLPLGHTQALRIGAQIAQCAGA